jgi:hypothetical protein
LREDVPNRTGRLELWCKHMPDCRGAEDWTVEPSGYGGGSVICGSYRARYKTDRAGVIRIMWIDAPEPGPDYGDIERAAKDACRRAAGRP